MLAVGLDGNPIALHVEHLEAIGRAAHEEGDEVDVLMASRPGCISRRVGRRGIMQDTQDAVAPLDVL